MTLPKRRLTGRIFLDALYADGFVPARHKGVHQLYRRRDGRRILVTFNAPGDTFAPGTLRMMITRAGWADRDLVRLGLVRHRQV